MHQGDIISIVYIDTTYILPYNIMSLFTQYKIGTEVKNRGINKRKKDTMYINIIWYINRQLYHSPPALIKYHMLHAHL